MENCSDKIVSYVKSKQDVSEMLHRSLSTIVRLYKGRCHFIFELLQNAEDAGASRVSFIIQEENLIFLHNGRPFTTENIRRLCDVANSDKLERNNIGKFGVGFKAVFTICDTVKIYSNPENYTGQKTPDMFAFACKIVTFTNLESLNKPNYSHIDGDITTKFVFHYAVKKDQREDYLGFSDLAILKGSILKEIRDINNTVLLFLHNIKAIHYESFLSVMPCKGEFSLETLSEQKKQSYKRALVLCTAGDKKLYFLKYSKKLDDKTEKTVDLAIGINVKEIDGKKTVSLHPVKDSSISVYFPTGEKSFTPFVLHGPYTTTPNRESIPFESSDTENFRIIDKTCELYKDVLIDLRDKKLISVENLESVLILSVPPESTPITKKLVDVSINAFWNESLIPSADKKYIAGSIACICDFGGAEENRAMAKLLANEGLSDLLGKTSFFVNTEIAGKSVLRDFFTQKVCIPHFFAVSYISGLKNNPGFLKNKDVTWLMQFYKYLESYVDFSYGNSAWNELLLVPFVLTTKGALVAPYRENKYAEKKWNKGFKDYLLPNIFLPTTAILENIDYVDNTVYRKNKELFDDNLEIPEYSDFDSFINSFERKYCIEKPSVQDLEHIGDLKTLLSYFEDSDKEDAINAVVMKANFIRCFKSDDPGRKIHYVNPNDLWVVTEITQEKVSSLIYFEEIEVVNVVDSQFYEKNGLDSSRLEEFNIYNDLKTEVKMFTDGNSSHEPQQGFRPKLFFKNLIQNVEYIDSHNNELSKKKSAEIMRLLEYYKKELHGIVIRGKEAQAKMEVDCAALYYLKYGSVYDSSSSIHYSFDTYKPALKWVYKQNGEKDIPGNLTRNEISEAYDVSRDSKIFKLLGFKQTPQEVFADTISEFAEAHHMSALEIRRALLFSLGIDEKEFEHYKQFEKTQSTVSHDKNLFDDTFEFPGERVKNPENYSNYASKRIKAARDVEYAIVQRRVRSSDISHINRDFIKNKYQYSGHPEYYACQMCESPSRYVECVQIEAYPTKEIEEMHLCLCLDCARDYKYFRDIDNSINGLLNRIEDLDFDYNEDTVILPFDESRHLKFRASHFLVIREILKQLREIRGKDETTENKTYINVPMNNNSKLGDTPALGSVLSKYHGNTNPEPNSFPIDNNPEKPRTISEIFEEVRTFPFYVKFSIRDKVYYKVVGYDEDKDRFNCYSFDENGNRSDSLMFLPAESRRYFRWISQ